MQNGVNIYISFFLCIVLQSDSSSNDNSTDPEGNDCVMKDNSDFQSVAEVSDDKNMT